jgi:hypothetical protein
MVDVGTGVVNMQMVPANRRAMEPMGWPVVHSRTLLLRQVRLDRINRSPSLLSGEEMTCRSPSDWRFAGYECDWSIHLVVFGDAAALAFTNAAMFLKLSAMTPSPTHRAMPSVPW